MGSGTIICDFNWYDESCVSHLNEKLDDTTPYNKNVKLDTITAIKADIT